MIKVSLFLTCLVISSKLLNGSAKPSVDMNRTVTVGVIYGNQPMQWTRQQMLQTTLNRLKLKSSLLKDTEFLFHYINGSNLRSINHCLKLMCEELLPRDVQAIIITLDDFESQVLSQWASLIGIAVLGTSRNIDLENKIQYKDYHYLFPSLSEESTVLLRILTILGVNTFGVMSRDGDQESLIAASHLKNESDKSYLKPLIFNLRETNTKNFKVEVIKVLVKLELHPVRVIVCVCDDSAIKTILDVARDLGFLSENYLWIFTERIVKHFHHIASNLLPQRMIGIRLNVTEDVIALRAACLFVKIMELKLQNNYSTSNTLFDRFSSCKEYATRNTSGNASHYSDFRNIDQNNYDIIGRSAHHINSTSYRVIANLSPAKGMSIIGKTRLLKEYHMDDMSNSSKNRLQIVTIDHGQYTYQVQNVYPKCLLNKSTCKTSEQTCEVGIPCTKYISSGINSYRSVRICVAGLMIELLNLLQNDLHFTFDIYIVRDSKYGGYDNESGTWNGMIGDIITGDADLALATLTTTSKRSMVVDFSSPYGEVGIGLLTSVVNEIDSTINLDFLLPFTLSIWITILVTIVTVWTVIWAFDKISAKWHLKGRAGLTNNKKKALFLESMSYAWSTLVHVQAGSGLPQSHSARFVALFFAFATLIVGSSYTAELAAHKVKEEVKQKISGIFDEKMLNPPENFKYGTLKDSSTEAFFKFSEDPRLRQIYQNMKDNNVDRVEDGVKKLSKGEFQVYIDDRPYLEHLVSSRLNCSLRVVDNSLGMSGYALALRKNSKWTLPFSLSIMKLNDNNILPDLWAKWLKRKCITKEEFDKLPTGMTIANVNGLFLTMTISIAIGVVFFIIENAISYFRKTKQKSINVMCCQMNSEGNTWPAVTDSVARDPSVRGVQLLRHFTNKAFAGSTVLVDNNKDKR